MGDTWQEELITKSWSTQAFATAGGGGASAARWHPAIGTTKKELTKHSKRIAFPFSLLGAALGATKAYAKARPMSALGQNAPG